MWDQSENFVGFSSNITTSSLFFYLKALTSIEYILCHPFGQENSRFGARKYDFIK